MSIGNVLTIIFSALAIGISGFTVGVLWAMSYITRK